MDLLIVERVAAARTTDLRRAASRRSGTSAARGRLRRFVAIAAIGLARVAAPDVLARATGPTGGPAR